MAEYVPLEVLAWIKKLDPSKSMVLEGFPTKVMMMMTMMMTAATVRHLLGTCRGTGVIGDPTNT